MVELFRLVRSLLERGDVELLHGHHGAHACGVADQLEDVRGDDLPTEAELVRQPAAGDFLAAVGGELGPVVVDLGLGFAADDEGEGFGELVGGAAVEEGDLLAFDLEVEGEQGTGDGVGIGFVGAELVELAAVGEEGEVEAGGGFGVVVEPEEGSDLVHCGLAGRNSLALRGLACFDVVDALYGRGDHGAGVFEGGDGFVVAAAEAVGADLAHLLEHLQAVLEVADAAALVVAPGYGDFHDGVLQLARDEEDLGVEAPALDGLEAEDCLGGVALEGLEAALRVLEGKADDFAGDPVETAAEEAAVDGLVDGLLLLVEPAGADGYVGAVVDGFDEALGFFDGGGEVGVGEHDDVACGLEEAVADGVAFAAVAGVLDEMQAGVRGPPALDDGGCAVGGAVVDYENFCVPGARCDAGEHAGECGFDARALVVRGNDDAETRMRHEVAGRPFIAGAFH